MHKLGLRIIVKALERVEGQYEERYLLRKDHADQQYQLIGKVGPIDGDPLKAASQVLEVQLGGIRVGWDLIVESLDPPEGVRGVRLYQGFFVRPVWEFAYLWAGETLRWYSMKELNESLEVDRKTMTALPSTLATYLHKHYNKPFQVAVSKMPSYPDSLVLRGIDPHHRAALGAILRRRLLALERDGHRVLNRVSVSEPVDGEVRLSLHWRSGTPTDPHAIVRAGWQLLAQPGDEDVINGGRVMA